MAMFQGSRAVHSQRYCGSEGRTKLALSQLPHRGICIVICAHVNRKLDYNSDFSVIGGVTTKKKILRAVRFAL